jgi:hypothetical protein
VCLSPVEIETGWKGSPTFFFYNGEVARRAKRWERVKEKQHQLCKFRPHVHGENVRVQMRGDELENRPRMVQGTGKD